MYTLFEYAFGCLEELDATILEVLYVDVFPHKVLPILKQKLCSWPTPNMSLQEAYASLRLTLELTPDEFSAFVSESMDMLVFETIWWVPHSYIQQSVQDLAFQYMWHIPVEQLLKHIDLQQER